MTGDYCGCWVVNIFSPRSGGEEISTIISFMVLIVDVRTIFVKNRHPREQLFEIKITQLR